MCTSEVIGKISSRKTRNVSDFLLRKYRKVFVLKVKLWPVRNACFDTLEHEKVKL